MNGLNRTDEESYVEIGRITKEIVKVIGAPEMPGKIDTKMAVVALSTVLCNISLMASGGDIESTRKFLYGMADNALLDAEKAGVLDKIKSMRDDGAILEAFDA